MNMKTYIANKEVTTKSDKSFKEFSTMASNIPPVKTVSGTIGEEMFGVKDLDEALIDEY